MFHTRTAPQGGEHFQVPGRGAPGPVHQEDHQVRALGHEAERWTPGLHRIRGVPEARGIEEGNRDAVQVQIRLDVVPGGPVGLGYYGTFFL